MSRLQPTDIVESPLTEAFKTRGDRAPSSMVWIECGPCFQHESILYDMLLCRLSWTSLWPQRLKETYRTGSAICNIVTEKQNRTKSIWLRVSTQNKLERHLWIEPIPAPGYPESELRNTFLHIHRQDTSQWLIFSLLRKAASSSSY